MDNHALGIFLRFGLEILANISSNTRKQSFHSRTTRQSPCTYLAHSERDMPSPLHYLDPAESNHENFFSGEDMLPDAALDLLNNAIEYNMVVDSTTGMLLPFVASHCS